MVEAKDYQPLLYDKYFKDYRKFTRHTPEYNIFWKEQKHRLKHGYTPKGGTWIPGNYYFYLNFGTIRGLPENGLRKTNINPIYRDQDHEYFVEIDNAKKGGYGLIVLKARRKGFSYMNAVGVMLHEFIVYKSSENGVGTQIEDYLLDFKEKFMIGYNNLPPELRPKIYKNNEDKLVSGYKKKENGEWVVKGLNSVINWRIMDNPGAFRGTSLNYMIFEEAGEFKKLKAGYRANEEAFREGSIQFGTPIIGGTSNQMENTSDDYMEMYYNAEKYNLKSLFIPSSKVYYGFFDKKYGKSDIEGATADIERRAEEKKATGDINDYFTFLQEMPLKEEHAFTRAGTSPFRIDLINKQIANINTNKAFDIVRYGRLEWQKTKDGKEIFGSNPIWIDAPGNVDMIDEKGNSLYPYRVVEMPLDGYVNAHVSGVDPYHISDDLEEIQKNGRISKDRSEGSMCVYRRFVPGDVPCEMPVAFYVERPESKDEFYEKCLKLAIFYNSPMLIEYNDDRFFEYLINKKQMKYLRTRPRSADSPYSTVSNKFGIHMKQHQKKLATELLDEYIKEHWEDIYFVRLLNELCNFGTKNTDMAMSFAIALIHDMDNLHTVKTKEELNPKEQNPYGFAVWENVNGRLQVKGNDALDYQDRKPKW